MKPGRFMSWRNTGNKHCLATSNKARRRFLGHVVLDSTKSSFIPVVDILVRHRVCGPTGMLQAVGCEGFSAQGTCCAAHVALRT